MRLKGEYVFEGNRRVYKYGIFDHIKLFVMTLLMTLVISALLIGVFFINSFRWTL